MEGLLNNLSLKLEAIAIVLLLGSTICGFYTARKAGPNSWEDYAVAFLSNRLVIPCYSIGMFTYLIIGLSFALMHPIASALIVLGLLMFASYMKFV